MFFMSNDIRILIVLIGFIFTIKLTKGYSNTHRDWDICSHWNGRRHFLELGERGELHAHNVSASNYRSTLYTPPPLNNLTSYNRDIWYQCNLELVTCAECVIRITFIYTNFSKVCQTPINVGSGNQLSAKCPCEHVLFSEPPYDPSGQDFCGSGKVFRSKTRALLLKFYFRATYSHVFSLQYFSERNVKIISGSPRKLIVNKNHTKILPQFISTPYFPIPYPRDYGVEHIVTCESEDCHVRLEFTDFQLGITSTLEIFDSNGQMIDSYTGEYFRPPIIISSGKSLLLQFRGNGVTGLGYKAEITFISAEQVKDKSMLPFTDCGGMVESLGGAITMMKMIDNETETKLYDCIWIIKPSNNYLMMKTHISVRVDSFLKMFTKSELVIREGVTSKSEIIETILWPNNGITEETHIVPIQSGYYIRLRGVFGINSRLAIVFSVFNYMSCYIGSEFLCQNNHCISVRLHCDGFDHCGDASDEPESCQQEWSHIQRERSWYSHKPNYYFPKIDQYPDLKTATGIFVMSTLGILVVLSGWMMILYRMGVRARHQRELQSHLQTISELLDRQEDLPTIEDHPPDYEAPPDYEDVIKLGMENEESTPRRNRPRRSPRNRPDRHTRTDNNNNNSNNHNNNDVNQCSLQLTVPAASIENHTQTENFTDIVNLVLNATGMCETSMPSTSTAASERRNNKTTSQIRPISCESSVSNGGFISDTNPPQQSSNYSIGNSAQYEECSAGFRDESLNISFSLAIPKSTAAISESKPRITNIYNENNHLKKSWIIFNNGHHQIMTKRQRLRQTYSSPETFLNDFFLSDENMNYGAMNIRSERNSYMSNGTMFGSDLSSDPISITQDKIITNAVEGIVNNENDLINSQKLDETPIEIIANNKIDELDDDDITCQNIELLPQELQEQDDPEISCFGTVSLFGGSKKKQITNKNRHVRSKSFNHIIDRNPPNIKIKRCSSADLLMEHGSITTSSSGYYI